MSPITHKFVAVLNKKISISRAMNALGHMTAGLAASYDRPDLMRFDNYIDKDAGMHKHISDNPFIILRADNSNKIRTFRQALIERNFHFTDFTNTMVEGTYKEQQERTANTLEADLEYYGICVFAESDKLQELTKKFSLWHD